MLTKDQKKIVGLFMIGFDSYREEKGLRGEDFQFEFVPNERQADIHLKKLIESADQNLKELDNFFATVFELNPKLGAELSESYRTMVWEYLRIKDEFGKYL